MDMARTTSKFPKALIVDSNSAVSYNVGSPIRVTYSSCFVVRGYLNRYPPVLRWFDGPGIRHFGVFNQTCKFVRKKLFIYMPLAT